MSQSGLSAEERDDLAELIEDGEEETREEQGRDRHKDAEFQFREPGHDFSDVVAMDHLKRMLVDKVQNPIEDREEYQRYGIQGCINGVLLYGPPRTGKSFLAEGFAGEAGYNYVKVNASDIKDPRVGVSEKNVKALVQQAVKFQPCIVQVDEIEGLSGSREGESHSHKQDLVGVFLNEMEELEEEDAVIIGTTNHPGRIDEAFLQPGRFSEQFYVGLPSEQMRIELIEQGLSQAEEEVLNLSEIDVDRAAELTEGFTCGDILQGAVYEAKLKALKRGDPINNEHLLYGVEMTDRSVVSPEKYRL
ncbi:AAA family ATPase [Salinirussus salinus]|uniref:AAA family ATPase n=1 Tax=Salinirussus salinus TaxID=1198300 RepID=UPI00135A4802|nr:ATP-binding protein [Salinirussus salinus]